MGRWLFLWVIGGKKRGRNSIKLLRKFSGTHISRRSTMPKVPFEVRPSSSGSKRFVAVFPDGGRVHFGQPGAETFIDGATLKKKQAYLVRHGSPLSGQNWKPSGVRTAGFMSRWVLWGPTRDLATNVRRLGGKYV